MIIKLHLSQTPLSGKVTLKAAMAEQLPLDRGQADEEWRNAPADQMLRSAHLAAEARMAAATCPGERSAGDHQQR